MNHVDGSCPTPVEPVVLSSWADIEKQFLEFPPPQDYWDDDLVEPATSAWVFRGIRDSRYCLVPSIERVAPSTCKWADLEILVSNEFKSRAQMHIGAASAPTDDLSWLALMQHYGVPTRLLDFTYSPFVALYFALRTTTKKRDSQRLRIWAIDSQLLNHAYLDVVSKARKAEVQRKAELERKSAKAKGAASTQMVGFRPSDFETNSKVWKDHIDATWRTIRDSLYATGVRSSQFNKFGCVCA